LVRLLVLFLLVLFDLKPFSGELAEKGAKRHLWLFSCLLSHIKQAQEGHSTRRLTSLSYFYGQLANVSLLAFGIF